MGKRKLLFISPKESLIDKALEIIKNGGNTKDLSHYSIITPSKRIQTYILNSILKEIKTDFIPPELLTIEELFYKIYEENFGIANKLSLIEKAYKIFEIVEKIEKKESENFSDFSSKFTLFLSLADTVDEILKEADTELFKKDENFYKDFIEKSGGKSEILGITKHLLSIVKSFYNSGIKNEFISSGIVFRRILNALLNHKKEFTIKDKNYIFLGFHILSYAESELIKFIKENSSMDFYYITYCIEKGDKSFPYKRTKSSAEKLGFQKEEIEFVNTDNSSMSDKIEIIKTETSEDEFALLKEKIKEAIKNKKNNLQKIAVVLSDPQALIPSIQNIASSIEDSPFNITLQYPLERTAIFTLINSILELYEKEKISHSTYLSIIRHPYLKATDDEEGDNLKIGIHDIENYIAINNITEINIKEIEEFIKEKHGEESKVYKKICNMHSIFIPEDIRNSTPNNIVEHLKRVLKIINEKTAHFIFAKEFSSIAYRVLNEASDFFGELNGENLKDTIKIIRFYLKKAKIPFYGSPLKGIQILGLMETRGIKFDKVFIFDSVEGILPPSFKYNPLLPTTLREKFFKMKTYKDAESIYENAFFNLIFSSKGSIIIYPEKRFGEYQEKSRFIEKILFYVELIEKKSLDKKTVEVLSNIDENEKNNELNLIIKDSFCVQKIKSMKFSPSSIENYINCPMKFYFEYILNIKEKETLTEDATKIDIGNIAHAVLKNFYKDYTSKFNYKNEEIREEIGELIEDEFKEKKIDSSSPLNKAIVLLLKERLSRFVADDLKKLKEKYIKRIEHEKVYNLIFPVDKNEIKLYGKIDRLEKYENLINIIDYKTGNINKKIQSADKLLTVLDEIRGLYSKNIEDYKKALSCLQNELKSFQLFFYTFLFYKNEKIKNKKINACYVSLKKMKREAECVISKKDRENIDDFIKLFESILKEIILDILKRNEFASIKENNLSCRFCPYKTLCRNF